MLFMIAPAGIPATAIVLVLFPSGIAKFTFPEEKVIVPVVATAPAADNG
jgi:hypothetical protein